MAAEQAAVLQREEWIALLRHVPAFAGLSPAALGALAGALQEEQYPAGSHVITESEQGDTLYLVAQGSAEASTTGSDGPIPLASYGPGEIFGEIALVTASHHRMATVTATTPLTVLLLAADALEHVLQDYPEAEDVLSDAAETMVVAKFLKQASPFARLDPAQSQQLARRLKPLAVQPGIDIMRQGEPGNTCYLLREGQVAVLLSEEGGGDRQIATLGPGTIFGEVALLTDTPRNATVRALEPCRLLVLLRSDLLETLQTDQQLGREMVELIQLRDRPRQVPDIVVSRRTSADGAVITTLKDPRRSAYYRLSPQGYFIWQRLDGRHTLRDLTLEYLVAFKVFAPQAISGMIEGLVIAGFVEAKRARREVADKAGESLSRSRQLSDRARRLVEWHVSIPSPDTALSRLYRSGGWLLFTRPAQILLAAVGITGLVVFAANLGEARRAPSGSGWVLLLFFLIYFIMIVLHETGHALTVKHYGREVPHAGVGWYWFGPMAYCDTSDMWLTDRWPRIVVTLGGLYASLIVAGTSAILAVILGTSVLAAMLWQLAFLSFYAVVVNLNPLLELDGYFILMDWLDRPNLREHCLAWLGNELPRALRNRAELRRHRLELFYGLGAVLYVFVSAFLLLVVYRVIIQGWLDQAMPVLAAASIAWALTGTLVALTLMTLAGDLRTSRRPVGASLR